MFAPRRLHAVLLLSTLLLPSACDLRQATQGYSASSELCGGNPSEACPLW